jgi:sugar phosphate isomerase/epimerase
MKVHSELKGAVGSRPGRTCLGSLLCLLGSWMISTTFAADSPVAPPNSRVPDALRSLLPSPDDETGFRPLFGAHAADGWAQCGPGGFTLSNGVATSHGGMGLWWRTNRMFTNFVVRGEWRFENRESDTGLFVRFADPGNDPWKAIKSGHELELGDDPDGKDPTWKTGTLYPFQPPTHVPTRPVGEWNEYELMAVGHTYIVRINSETVNVWTDPKQRSGAGFIGLQNYHDGKGTEHRRLRIRELASTPSASAPLAFFAFQNGCPPAPEKTAETLKALGYDGLSAEGFDVRPVLRELQARELKLYNTYLTLEFDAATNALTPPLRTLIDDLQGTGAALWIAIPKVTRDGTALPKSSPEGDAIATGRLTEIADYAEPRGVKIALYPHTWFWLERVADAVRLADRMSRAGVGSTFNLCHWLKVEGDTDPVPMLKAALPRLLFVSINGADAGDTRAMDWDRLIQPMDRGSYDVGALVRRLRALGYSGPVGLQGYNVKGDRAENLARSIQAWRAPGGAAPDAPAVDSYDRR